MPSDSQNSYQPPQEGWTQAAVPGKPAYSGPMRPGQPLPPEMGDIEQQPFESYVPQTPMYSVPDQPPEASPEASQPQADNGQANTAVTYQVPDTGITPPEKQFHLAVWIAGLAAAALILFLVLNLATPSRMVYATVRSGQMESNRQGDAVLVRDETVYSQEGVSQITYMVEEGQAVERATQVALVYSSGFSAKEWTKLRNFRTQLKEYQKQLINAAAGDAQMVARVTKVKERALEAQQLVHGVRGSLTTQEILLKNAMQDVQIYIKQTYSEDQKLTRLYEDENSQMQRISSWTKQYATAVQGIVSFYTDGFEPVLNMNNYDSFSPAQVRSMYRGSIPEDTAASKRSVSIYRIVRPNDWAILVLCDDTAWTPVPGRVYQVQIESFTNTIVEATLETSTLSGGELLLRLRVNNPEALKEIMYIRSCRILMGDSVSSLMVPTDAIYTQNGCKGVVVHTGSGDYWTGVEILNISDDGTQTFILPENPAVLYEGAEVRTSF